MYFTLMTEQDTEQLAVKLAERLSGGELLCLVGPLGAGKTTYVQALARGLGATVGASSPTFVLERRYPGRLELIHLDLYRLDDVREARMLIADACSEPEAVVAVEWADKFPELFGERDALWLTFQLRGEERSLEVRGPQALVEALS